MKPIGLIDQPIPTGMLFSINTCEGMIEYEAREGDTAEEISHYLNLQFIEKGLDMFIKIIPGKK